MGGTDAKQTSYMGYLTPVQSDGLTLAQGASDSFSVCRLGY
jgi:hypothetical protein